MDKNIEILKKQEDLLQFPHFNHSTAYEFGTFMVSCAQNQNITIAISIRMNNGWMHSISVLSRRNQSS